MEQAVAAGFLPSAASSNAAAFLRAGAVIRVPGVVSARTARSPSKWPSVASASAFTRTATPSSSVAAKLVVSFGSSSCPSPSSSSAGYTISSPSSSCIDPSSSTAANFTIDCRSFSSAASPSSAATSTLQAIIASTTPACLQFTGATCSSEAESEFPACFSLIEALGARCFVICSDAASSSSAYFADTENTGDVISEEAAVCFSVVEARGARCFVICSDAANSSAAYFADIKSSGDMISEEAAARFSAMDARAARCFVIVPGAASSSAAFFADTENTGDVISEEAAECFSAMESRAERCFVVFPGAASSAAAFFVDTKSTGDVISEKAAVRFSATEARGARCFVIFSDATSSSAASFADTGSYFCLRSGFLPSCGSLTNLSRRTNYCFISGAAGSWRDKSWKRSDCRCYALSEDKSGMSMNWEKFARLCLVCSLLQRTGYFDLPPPSQIASQVPASDWKRLQAVLLIYCLLIGYSAATGDKKMQLLVNVMFVRLCLVCSLLQRIGYFDLPML